MLGAKDDFFNIIFDFFFFFERSSKVILGRIGMLLSVGKKPHLFAFYHVLVKNS